MTNEDVIHLNLTGCKNAAELHERIRITFGFPDWYGCNWDAFYDLLRTDVAANIIIISGEYTVAADLRHELKNMHEVLDMAKEFNLHELNEIFTYKIIS